MSGEVFRLDSSQPVVMVGLGGHAQQLAHWLLEDGLALSHLYWLAERKEAVPEGFEGSTVLVEAAFLESPTLESASSALPACPQAIMGVGSVTASTLRLDLAQRLEGRVCWPLWVHPSAVVATSARLHYGVTVAARAVIQPEATLDALALINTSAIVEHHARIEAGAHVAPGAVVCGAATVGTAALVGAGAVVLQGRRVAAQATVPAGSVVR